MFDIPKKRDLIEELKEDRIIADLLSDMSIAFDFYQTLCTNTWCTKDLPCPEDELIMHKLKGHKKEIYSYTYDEIHDVLNEIRRNHSYEYIEFEMFIIGSYTTDLVLDNLSRIGWEVV